MIHYFYLLEYSSGDLKSDDIMTNECRDNNTFFSMYLEYSSGDLKSDDIMTNERRDNNKLLFFLNVHRIPFCDSHTGRLKIGRDKLLMNAETTSVFFSKDHKNTFWHFVSERLNI